MNLGLRTPIPGANIRERVYFARRAGFDGIELGPEYMNVPTTTLAHEVSPLRVTAVVGSVRLLDPVPAVRRDAYVCYRGNRYSVPWTAAGRLVTVREKGDRIELHLEDASLAVHTLSSGQSGVFTVPAHHIGIPLGSDGRSRKAQIHLHVSPPEVQARPLSVYDVLAREGGNG